MDKTEEDFKIKANLAALEAHFHNEGLNEIEKACECYTDEIVWEAQRSRPAYSRNGGFER
jgi:hypothetical protein